MSRNDLDPLLQNLWTTLQEPFYRNWAIQIAVDVYNYPFVLVQTLSQIGYEPLPPTPIHEFRSLLIENIQTNRFQLQSNWSYLNYIRSVDGVTGCYRGFFPYVCCHSIQYLTTTFLLSFGPERVSTATTGGSGIPNALRIIVNGTGNEERNVDAFLARAGVSAGDGLETEVGEKIFFLKETWRKLVCAGAGVICSHPFHVISVRCAAQFVGRETAYNSIFGSVAEIFKNDGFSGFFKGLMPRLIAEANYVIISSGVIFLVKKAFNYSASDPQLNNIWLKILAEYLANAVATEYSNPYMVVTNTMIVNNSGLAIGSMPHTRKYQSWREAMHVLTETKQIRRSADRVYNGPWIYFNGQLRPSHYFGPYH